MVSRKRLYVVVRIQGVGRYMNVRQMLHLIMSLSPEVFLALSLRREYCCALEH